MLNRAYLAVIQCHDRDSLAVQRNKFDLVCTAVAMNMHDSTHVPGSQLLAREIGYQHYPVMLV